MSERKWPYWNQEFRMEERCSVNSPRRILSFSKTRAANVSFSDADHRSPSELGVSGEHGPKLSEVYGFVGSITTVVFTGTFHIVLVDFAILVAKLCLSFITCLWGDFNHNWCEIRCAFGGNSWIGLLLNTWTLGLLEYMWNHIVWFLWWIFVGYN